MSKTDPSGVLRSRARGTYQAAVVGNEEFETIKIPQGATREFRTSEFDGAFENKLLDITADGAVARVIVDGQSPTVRNVAWRGVQDAESFAVLAIDATGDILIENVYMGDGSAIGSGAGGRVPTAMWASPESSGTLTVRNAHIEDWDDNGMYLSAPNDLRATIEGCYVSDCNNAEYRVGTDGSVIRDSVVHSGQDRGVWAWGPGTFTVDNCHIAMQAGADAFWAGEKSNPGATINVKNTQYEGGIAEPYGTVNIGQNVGNNPENFFPNGCPKTAIEAVTGGGAVRPEEGGIPPWMLGAAAVGGLALGAIALRRRRS